MAKKILCSIISVLLCGTIFFSSAGCRLTRDGEEIDDTRTQLYVGIYNGGFGTDWWTEVKKEFEELYKNESFEKGKTGVQLMPKYGKEIYEPSVLEATMDTMDEDVFMIDRVTYHNYIQKDKLLDITDVAKQVVNGKPVHERMLDELDQYYNIDGKYYALPYIVDVYQMVYDVDLWDEYGFWMNDEGEFQADVGEGFKKSAGQDGQAGTYDDGLPVTYSQFFQLLQRIKQESCVPFTWTSDYWNAYFQNFSEVIKGYYDGEDEFLKNYAAELDTTGVNVTLMDLEKFKTLAPHTYGSFSEAPLKAISSEKNVTWHNIADLQLQPSVYYTLCFAKDIMDESNGRNFTAFSVGSGESHMAAQERFLRSVVEPQVTDGRVAMLIDGGWWENEASWVFEDMAKNYDEKYSMENRRFGIMPIPLPDDRETPYETKFVSTTGTMAMFAKKSTDVPELAKKFLSFIYSYEGAEILTNNGFVLPFDYGIDVSDSDTLTYYKKQRIEVYNAKNLMFNVPNSTIGKYNENLIYSGWNFGNSRGIMNAFRVFFEQKWTPEQYFLDTQEYYKNQDITGLD